jgi:hypothetical protein
VESEINPVNFPDITHLPTPIGPTPKIGGG